MRGNGYGLWAKLYTNTSATIETYAEVDDQELGGCSKLIDDRIVFSTGLTVRKKRGFY